MGWFVFVFAGWVADGFCGCAVLGCGFEFLGMFVLGGAGCELYGWVVWQNVLGTRLEMCFLFVGLLVFSFWWMDFGLVCGWLLACLFFGGLV